jgi:hypothetical protein
LFWVAEHEHVEKTAYRTQEIQSVPLHAPRRPTWEEQRAQSLRIIIIIIILKVRILCRLYLFRVHSLFDPTAFQFRFQFLTATSTEMAVFWDVAPCSLVDIDRRFRDYFPDDGGSKHIWNVVSIYQSTWRNIPEDSHPRLSVVLSKFLLPTGQYYQVCLVNDSCPLSLFVPSSLPFILQLYFLNRSYLLFVEWQCCVISLWVSVNPAVSNPASHHIPWFCRTRRLITVSVKARQWILPRVITVQSTPNYCNIILPSTLSNSDFPTKFLYAFLISITRPPCSLYLIHLHLITLIIFGEHKLWIFPLRIFFSLLFLPSPSAHIFSSAPYKIILTHKINPLNCILYRETPGKLLSALESFLTVVWEVL